MTDILQQDIQYLPGVGPNRKKMLNDELGIQTFGDLLQYYPYKHVDRSRLYNIRELTGDMPFVQVKGHILSFETFKMSARKERVVAHFTDGSGKVMDLTWFNGGNMPNRVIRLGRSISSSDDRMSLTAASTSRTRTSTPPISWSSPPWACNPTITPRRR